MAIPTTRYTDPLTWQDQEVMSELKLDAQQANSDYLRDMMRNRPLLWQGGIAFDNFDTGAGALGDQTQVRFSIRPNASVEAAWTNPVATRLIANTRINETYWADAVCANFAWATPITTGVNRTFEFEWQWRPDEGTGWASLGQTTFYGVHISDEFNDYISFWAQVVAARNFRRFNLTPMDDSGWIFCAYRGLTAIAGRLNENFGGGYAA